MAGYRNISVSFWTDSKVDDDFTPEDKYFYLYLMTNPHTSLCGCYEISMKQMERETGYNADTVNRLLQRMEEMHGVIQYSAKTKEVLILNWWKYNWSSSAKVKNAIVSVADHIKHEPFRRYVMHRVSIRYGCPMHTTDTDTVSESDTDTVSDTVTETETEYREREADTRTRLSTDIQQSFQQIENHPNIRLTEEEYKTLRNLDYSKTKKSLEVYLAIMDERIAAGREYKDHFLTLRKWAMQDGATVSNSSINDYDLERIMNPYGI